MYHFNCTIMCINPHALVNHDVQIESTARIDRPDVGTILTISVTRIKDGLPGIVTLMRGCDPDGNWSEDLKSGDLPRSIKDLFSDFKVKDETGLVRPDRLRVNGLYFMDSLVGLSPFVCLSRFPEHSFAAWYWDEARELYSHSCSLLGCNFKETGKEVRPGGISQVLNVAGQPISKNEQCNHEWNHWKDLSDRFGLYIPPFLYKSVCSKCGAQWLAESLFKGQ